MRKIVKRLKSLIQRGRWLIKLPFEKHYYVGESYFPEFVDRRKSTSHVYWDQCIYIIKYGTPNSFFFLYGFDIKGLRQRSQFVDYSLFMRRRNEMNYRITWTPPISVLRDKALFGIVAEAYGFNTPKNIGIFKDGNVFLFDSKDNVDFRSFLSSTSFFDFF